MGHLGERLKREDWRRDEASTLATTLRAEVVEGLTPLGNPIRDVVAGCSALTPGSGAPTPFSKEILVEISLEKGVGGSPFSKEILFESPQKRECEHSYPSGARLQAGSELAGASV
ncbi:hypothetical protein CRG98_007297 [Punica granatum]|uniref:Uncharacterized protein n=1 Tax=Punica granatum TaxID=22663 RepID=A0A2I0KV19_PUNGR|nr:hypothetical protein CRG98_007297 [Punica granatum]